jgi:hypothetical protein
VIRKFGKYEGLKNIKHHEADLSISDPDLSSGSEGSSWNGEGEPPWPSYMFDQGRWLVDHLQEMENRERSTLEWVKVCSQH